jgi:CheY-like chemotaxis protein
MKLRTTLQLASFFPIFLAALFAADLFVLHVFSGAAGADGGEAPATGAMVMSIFALLAGWGFYRKGRTLSAQIGALEAMAERVRHGDLTPEDLSCARGQGGVMAVARVFSQLVVELRGYVDLIRAHDALKREIEAAAATARRLREAAVPVSGALELLRRAELGIIEYLMDDNRFLLAWLPPGSLREAVRLMPEAPPDIQNMLCALVASPDGKTVAKEDRRVPVAQPRTVSVKDALDVSMHLCRWLWKRNGSAVEVAMECDSSGPFDVEAERLGLVHAGVAILQNAAEAMPQGGRVTIDLGTDSSGAVAVTIADTGHGMSEAVLERCMRPFFSTREDRLGMGLPLAARLVGRWEGRLGVISDPGHGTTVHLSFPRPRDGQPVAPARTSEPLRILVVEDDAVTRDMLTQLLGREKHRVTAVEDGAAAILALRQGRFDVVVTDRAMPIMTGDELALLVKKQASATAVVMLTGLGEAMNRRHQRPAGVDIVVAKPVGREDLRVAIERALEAAAASAASSQRTV